MKNDKATSAIKSAISTSKKTWGIAKRLSLWTWEKSNRTYFFIKNFLTGRAEKKRLEIENLALERGNILTVMANRAAKTQDGKNEGNRLEHEKELIRLSEERQLRHEILLETLEDDFNTLDHSLSVVLKKISKHRFLRLVLASESTLGEHYRALLMNKDEVYIKIQDSIPHYISRTVADISEKEMGLLKMISYLNLLGIIKDEYFDKVQLAIAYNQGTCSFYIGKRVYSSTNTNHIIFHFLPFWAKTEVEKSAVVINEAIATIGQVRKTIKDPKLKATIEKEILGAKGWLRVDSLQKTGF